MKKMTQSKQKLLLYLLDNKQLIKNIDKVEILYKKIGVMLTQDVISFCKKYTGITIRKIGTSWDYNKNCSAPMYGDTIIIEKTFFTDNHQCGICKKFSSVTKETSYITYPRDDCNVAYKLECGHYMFDDKLNTCPDFGTEKDFN